MTQISRRAVAQALLDHLLAASGLHGVVKISGRRLKHWKDLQKAESNPALFVCSETEDPRSDWGLSAAPHLDFTLYLYTYGERSGVGPQDQLDDLVDAVKAALAIDRINKTQTLGGKITNCRITRIETDGGLLDPQAVAWIRVAVINT